MVTVRTAHLDEPLVQVAALQVFPHDPGYDGAKNTVRFGVSVAVALFKLLVINGKNPPKRVCFGLLG